MSAIADAVIYVENASFVTGRRRLFGEVDRAVSPPGPEPSPEGRTRPESISGTP